MIRDRSEELGAFHTRHFAEQVSKHPTSTNGHRRELTDEEVIELASGAKNAAKFEALWGGDTTGYTSHSEADQALVSLLAFYTQDEGQLDSLYQRSGLCREKWLKRSGYRRSTIERALFNLTDTYTPSDDGARMVVGNGHAILPSPSPSLYRKEGRGRKLEAVRFAEMKVLEPRRYLLKDLVLAAYVTLLYGDGGVAKSLLTLVLAVAVSGGSKKWLGRKVENCPVLYVDFELDSEEQARRVHQLCHGQGLDTPPDNLLYSELAEEATLNAAERVKLALEGGPAYPREIAEHTGLAVKTVKNALTGLRKQGAVEPTGEVENRTEQVRLSVPASLYRDAGTVTISARSERSSSWLMRSWAKAGREERSEVDVSRGEAVEHELNRLIEKRHDQRTASEERRRSEDGWAESTVRYNVQRRRELRTAWRAYHEDRAAALRRTLEALICHHETEAAKLQVEDEPEKETA